MCVKEQRGKRVIIHLHLLLLCSLLRGLRDFATFLSLLNGLNDTDSNGLSHVTDGETTKRWVLRIRLHTHWLAGDKLGDACITRLDELGGLLDRFARSAIDLLKKFGEFASNVGRMAIEDRSITSTNLTGVVEDDDLGVERRSLLGRVILGVGSDIAAANILDGHVLHVETDIVTRNTFYKLLVVHFDGLDFSGDARGSKCNNHPGLDDTSLDTANRDSANTTNFVDILKGKAKWFVGWTNWRLDGVDGFEESFAFNGTTLDLLGPTLVPWHVGRFLQHVVTMPAGNGYECDGLGVIADLFNEGRSLLYDLIEAVLTPLSRVHFVDGNNQLTDT